MVEILCEQGLSAYLAIEPLIELFFEFDLLMHIVDHLLGVLVAKLIVALLYLSHDLLTLGHLIFHSVLFL